jgi:uncharacterized circularly permuted ATP-grasp superfamily protein
MLIGPKSTKKEQQEFIAKIKHNPRNYIAQPMINLFKSTNLDGRYN